MQLFNYSFRYLLKNRGNSLARLLSLSMGVAIALLVFSYVGLNLSFNNSFPNKERVFQVWAKSPQIGGMAHKLVKPLAPNLVADIPQVEAAVHFEEVQKIFGTTDNLMEATALQTNSSFFDVLDFGVISGDPHRILSSEGAAGGEVMISERLAKKMFGDDDPLGKKLGNEIVAGVFQTPAVNQSIGDFDILEHLPYDSDDEIWTGQDSYTTFIKLCEGADIAQVEAVMPEFVRNHGIEDYCKEWQMTYHFVPLTSTIYVESDVRAMQMIYSAIALIALVVACMNYVLLTISSLSERSRTIATMKCNGASRAVIFRMLMAETFLILLVSVAVAAVVLTSMHSQIFDLFGYKFSDIFALERIWIPLLVCLLAFAVAGIVPAMIFSVVSVDYAFRRGGDNRAWWKKSLLFLQITMAVAVVIFLMVSNRQVSYLANADYGYKFDRLVALELSTKVCDAGPIADKLRTLPFVENVGLSSQSPLSGYSGMPCVDDKGNLLFSCRWDIVDHNYIPSMQMDIVLGRNFLPTDGANRVIVNEKYVEKRGWSDSPIGKTIYDSSMVPFEIVGVVADYRMMSTGEVLPIVLHTVPYISDIAPDYKFVVLYNILLTGIDEDNMKALDKAVSSIYDDYYKYKIITYQEWIDLTFADIRQMRDGMFIVAFVVLVISLIGLCGYLLGEMARRRKEIAVRKVCGATIGEVLAVLGTRFLWIVLPATVCGVAVAVWSNDTYLSTRAQMRCTVPWWLYLLGALLVVTIVYAVQMFIALRAAMANPVDTIKKNN
ncbi:MAG: ABC transporter permease [Bacteroidaceae bacterium]|nr:ABC transporter permease [Bacteroidaceae bacterium]